MGCNIDKMLIKGIRSFSPDNQNVIEFYRPLTLIVGHNGAGKTTIIECLKMATTGDLPPNTRSGQSFIHDPKVAGETEVKAQIKLRFLTQNRQPVVVIRSFQLTQKKATLQFKALDNVLQTVNRETGQKEALSYRCADIDRVVPQLMGVSKAVLENVIFVHQEESNWPLAEGQVLKKKFDDIFAATKYTKALEAMSKLRKEKTAEIKVMKANLETTKAFKDQAARLKSEGEEAKRTGLELERKIKDLQAQVQEAEARRDELSRQLDAIADFGEDLTRLRTQHEMLFKGNAEAFLRLRAAYGEEDMAMGLEELEQYALDMAPQLQDWEASMRKCQREQQMAQIELEAGKDAFARDVKAQGRLAAEADAHARNLADLQRFLEEQCARHGIQPAGSTEGTIVAFRQRLAEVGAQLEAAKASNRQTDDNLGRGIDQVATQLSSVAEAQRMKREQIQRNCNRSAELQAQFEHLVVSVEMLEEARRFERELGEQLQGKQQEQAASTHEEEARQQAGVLAELAAKASQLRQERDTLAATAEGATRLRLKGGELAQKEAELQSLLMGAKMRVNSLLGAAQGSELPPPQQLRGAVEEAVRRRAAEAADCERRAKEVQAKIAALDGQLAAVNRQLAGAKAEAETLKAQVEGGLQGEAPQAPPTPTLVTQRTAELEKEQGEEQTKLARMASYQQMFTHIKEEAVQCNRCMTCERPFTSDAEKTAFLRKQETEIHQIPDLMEQTKEKIAGAARRLHQLRSLQPMALRHETLTSSDIPNLERRVEALHAQKQEEEGQLGELQEHCAASSAELEVGRRLLEEVAGPVDRLHRDISARAAELDTLKRQTGAATADRRTVADVDRDLDEIDRQKARAEATREEAQRRQNRLRDEVAHLRAEAAKAKEEVMRLGAASEKRAGLENQVRELSTTNELLQAQIDEEQQKRSPLEAHKAQLMSEREAKRADMAAREAELEARLRSLHAHDSQLSAKQRAIEEYVVQGKGEQLDKLTAALEGLRTRQEACEAKLRALQAQQRQLDSSKNENETIKRQIEELTAYHRAKAEEAALAAKLEQTDAAQANVGNKAEIQAEYAQVDGRLQELRSDIDRRQGKVDVMRDRYKQCRLELDVPQYTDIEQQYRSQLVAQRTTEMASSDLEKYHKALEKALLSFHTAKMADINAIVKELWQKTYRNQDIDYIQIKADSDGGAQRSYNYRVVMHTGGAELDMRGRCSAGQKVLACLIIRLALAETFCLNCGILALDEPTTNLDADNSASLAEALRSIMLTRREQSNFQLVVITHDEVFARLIGTREHAEHLWRITKDENQKSLVTQEDIVE